MEETSTERFLRLMNERNARIAADEVTSLPSVDLIRERRQTERREKLGQLRARTHSGSRPKRPINIFPHVDLS